MPVARYGWTIAGPRDFAINLLINGGIAWWLFHDQQRVPLVGTSSLASLVVPMCGVLATATTYFGFLSGIRGRQSGRLSPRLEKNVRWRRKALVRSVRTGLTAAACAFAAALVCRRALPESDVTSPAAVAGVGVLAGCLGFALHTRAVLAAGDHGKVDHRQIRESSINVVT